MTAVKDNDLATDGLAIADKYEAVVNYLYPILQNAPRRHRILRDKAVDILLEPVGGLYHAARSRQVSRLHAVDAQFATLRFFLRLLVRENVRIVSPKQQRAALAMLSEPGKMIGAWQRRLNGSGAETRLKGQVGK